MRSTECHSVNASNSVFAPPFSYYYMTSAFFKFLETKKVAVRAPKAPRVWGVGKGCPLRGEVWGGACALPRIFFIIFGAQNR